MEESGIFRALASATSGWAGVLAGIDAALLLDLGVDPQQVVGVDRTVGCGRRVVGMAEVLSVSCCSAALGVTVVRHRPHLLLRG
jgi:hypothetical protein